MSATSLVFSSMLSLPSTVSSTTNYMYLMLSDMLQEEEKNDDNRNQYSISHPNWKKIQTEAIHPNSDFAGLFLLVVFAVRSAVDHQLTWEKVSKWDIPEKNFRKVREWSRWDVCPNKKIPPIAASYHFGASLKASRARSSYFEQREIEDWSWRQKWPFLCALQLCCWSEDLKTNSLGSRPAIMKM